MRNALILGLVGILIIIAGWYLVTTDAPEEQDPDAPEQILGTPAQWETFRSDPMVGGFGFTITHPRELEQPSTYDGIVDFKYLGAGNMPNTEITDGFLMSVRMSEINAETSLRTYAQNTHRTVDVTTLRDDQFDGREALAFISHSELDNSEIPHRAVRLDATTVADISYSIMGDVDDRYRNTVNRMIDSIIFTNSATSAVSIALLTDGGDTPARGCDDVVLVPVTIAPTQAPLTAALTALFALPDEEHEGYRNFIARTNSTLSFERATVEDGTAHIYFRGELSGLAGVCDDPRARIQIEETALQFETVDKVVLYLNGNETTLTPDMRGE